MYRSPEDAVKLIDSITELRRVFMAFGGPQGHQ
jgi:hypothetical protein